MSTKYGIQYPPLPNASTQAFIDTNVNSPTGNLMDDFRTALVSVLGLSDHNDLCLDDLWQRYIVEVVAGSSIEEPGSPASAGRGKGGYVGANPGHYISQENRNDANGSVGFPGGFDGTLTFDTDRAVHQQVTLSDGDKTVSRTSGTNGRDHTVPAHKSLLANYRDMPGTAPKLYCEFVFNGTGWTEFTNYMKVGLTRINGVTQNSVNGTTAAWGNNGAFIAPDADTDLSGDVSHVGGDFGINPGQDGTVVGMAWDVAAGTVYFHLDGSYPTAPGGPDGSTPDPETSNNPHILNIPGDHICVPFVGLQDNNLLPTASITMNLSEGDMLYGPPTGYTDWTGSQVNVPDEEDRPTVEYIGTYVGEWDNGSTYPAQIAIPSDQNIEEGDILYFVVNVDGTSGAYTPYSPPGVEVPRWGGGTTTTTGSSRCIGYGYECDGTENGTTFEVYSAVASDVTSRFHFFHVKGNFWEPYTERNGIGRTEQAPNGTTTSHTTSNLDDIDTQFASRYDKCLGFAWVAAFNSFGTTSHSMTLQGCADDTVTELVATNYLKAYTFNVDAGDKPKLTFNYSPTSSGYSEMTTYNAIGPRTAVTVPAKV